MKIAITTNGTDLQSSLDPRFGRCPFFLLVDSETLECEAKPNPGASAGGGAGIKAAQALTGLGAGALITGQCGPNAYQILEAAGLKIMQAPVVSARKAIEMYKQGDLASINVPGEEHQGMQGRVR
jgi:predicted Fe-Mo cluster-binding NifX family protein